MAKEAYFEAQAAGMVGVLLGDLRTGSFRRHSPVLPGEIEHLQDQLLFAAVDGDGNNFPIGARILIRDAGEIIAGLGGMYENLGEKITELGEYMLDAKPDVLRRIIRDRNPGQSEGRHAICEELQNVFSNGHANSKASDALSGERRINVANWLLNRSR